MSIIACWSPVCGLGRITINTGLLATYMALVKDKKLLVLDTHLKEGRLKEQLFPYDAKKNNQLFTYVSTHNLTAANFRLHTQNIIENKLSFLGLADPMSETTYRIEQISQILQYSQESFDFTFIDTPSGIYEEMAQMVLECADVVLVCLPQEDYIIERFVKRQTGYWHPALEDKRQVYMIGSYKKEFEHYTLKAIQRKYRIKKIFDIPENKYLHKAVMEGRLLRWMVSNYDVGRKDPSYGLFESLEQITNKIMETPGKKGLFSEITNKVLKKYRVQENI